MKAGNKVAKGNISRAEARRRAARFVISNLFRGMVVQDGAAANWNIDGLKRKDVWLLYPKGEREDGWIPARDLIVVCKRTGEVLYDRLAFPEAYPSRAGWNEPESIAPTGNRWLDQKWWE